MRVVGVKHQPIEPVRITRVWPDCRPMAQLYTQPYKAIKQTVFLSNVQLIQALLTGTTP